MQALRRTQIATLLLALAAGGVVAAAVWATAARGGAEDIDPASRAAVIAFEGCGHAGRGGGSGVGVGGELVLTAAHVVAQADVISVTVGGREYPARVVAWDGRRDLALLTAQGLDLPSVRFGRFAAGDRAEMVGGAASGTLPAEVVQVANVRIEEVLGTERHSRLGYRLAVAADRGDSGAGIFTSDDRLGAMLFATIAEDGVGWATAAAELEAALAMPRGEYRCVPERSRMLGD